MKEQFIEILIPTIAVLIFICAFIYVRKTNPQNKKIVTRTTFKSIFRKEKCPKCGCKMKKKWMIKDLGQSYIEYSNIYEREAQPRYICPICKYEIKEKFELKVNDIKDLEG